MKLWLISQTEMGGYDTYDSAVVAAADIKAAKAIHPHTSYYRGAGSPWKSYAWASAPRFVKAEYLGEARGGMPAGVVCASFNAG